ncbi:hypothetical protein LTR53_008937 [Teratosphaeriaceae sp. CCFEE 6253]|nr:hypothetical protein LTR53_008937 [Teratosphaeriaceae sp. CCFEE 6253]
MSSSTTEPEIKVEVESGRAVRYQPKLVTRAEEYETFLAPPVKNGTFLGRLPVELLQEIAGMVIPKFDKGWRDLDENAEFFPRRVRYQFGVPLAPRLASFYDSWNGIDEQPRFKRAQYVSPSCLRCLHILLVSKSLFDVVMPVYVQHTMFSFTRSVSLAGKGTSSANNVINAARIYVSQLAGELHEVSHDHSSELRLYTDLLQHCKVVLEFSDFGYHAQMRFNKLFESYDPEVDPSGELFYSRVGEWYTIVSEPSSADVCNHYRRGFEHGPTQNAKDNCDVQCGGASDLEGLSFRIHILGANDARTRCWVKYPRRAGGGTAPCSHDITDLDLDEHGDFGIERDLHLSHDPSARLLDSIDLSQR